MTRVRRSALAGLLLAGALMLALPAGAPAAGLPYSLTIDGAGELVAEPAGGGSTLAVDIDQTPGGVQFSPAATSSPSGIGQCQTVLDTTTCDAALVAAELRLAGDVVEAHVTGLTTSLLTFTGGSENDALVVDGGGAVASVALDPGAGADEVTLGSSVAGPITLAADDTGNDRYVIASTHPAIAGTLALGEGNDVASSLAPGLTLDGGAGDDVLSGAGSLIGGAGSDVFKPTAKDKVVAGGDGVGETDRLSFELVAGPLTLQKGVVPGEVQVLATTFSATGIEELEGTPGNDTMLGSTGRDLLFGGAGDDTIDGRGGGDLLDGGPGANSVSYANAAGPVNVNLGAGLGTTGGLTDTLISFRSVTTGAHNDFVVGTAAPEAFSVGAGDDVVDAGAGNDIIDGGPGNDMLRGGHNDDLINGGDGNDTATYDERSHSEPLVVTLATPGGDGAAGENDTLAVENVIGGASNDMLSGDDGPNYLAGGPGLDILDGGGGNDAIYGNEGRDSLIGGSGSDVLFGEGDDDSINAFDGQPDIVDCGASPDDDAQVDGSDTVAGCEYARRGDVPVPVDADGDGFVAGFDCDDANRAINPGATDVVGDGIDQNCDGFDEPVPFVDYGLSLSFSKATARGRRVMRLTVRDLPRGHRVLVSCTTTRRYAKRCPFTRRTRRPSRAGNVALTSLFRKRMLPPGTKLELQITAPGFNGRVRRFTIRRVGAVRDQRLCLRQGTRIPRRCPAGEE